ncbi:MAG TPA: AAA family ATPase [Clostridia bacterium]|nr:AAA family ATPase [Clostridia bacterium]
MPAASILLVDADPSAATSIGSVLSGVGYTVTTVSDGEEAIGHLTQHGLVILDVVTGPKDALALCTEIRATPAMAQIPVLCVSQTDEVEERIKFLEAGADDVVAKPVDARELEARVEALLLRFQRSRDLVPQVTNDGILMTSPRRIVAVYSPKGGVGTTTIATNIAVVAAREKPDRVVLVDFDLQFGAVSAHLDVTPKQTLADLVRDESALREGELLRSYAVKHSSGLNVLCAPPTPELGELITPEAVERLLGTLAGAYDQVVIDAGSVLDERTMIILETADTVVLPVYPEIPALKGVHTLLDYLNEAGTLGTKTVFVLNNAFARDILKPRDVEGSLGTKIAFDLPYDPFLYLKAVNEGIPVVLGAPRSIVAERLTRLTASVFGKSDFTAAPVAVERRGLFGGLRRRG